MSPGSIEWTPKQVSGFSRTVGLDSVEAYCVPGGVLGRLHILYTAYCSELLRVHMNMCVPFIVRLQELLFLAPDSLGMSSRSTNQLEQEAGGSDENLRDRATEFWVLTLQER